MQPGRLSDTPTDYICAEPLDKLSLTTNNRSSEQLVDEFANYASKTQRLLFGNYLL